MRVGDLKKQREQRESLAVEFYGQGQPTRAIADSLGVSKSWVSKVLKKNNIPLRSVGYRTPEYRKQVKEQPCRRLDPLTGLVTCLNCKTPQPPEEFYAHRPERKATSYRTKCRTCLNDDAYFNSIRRQFGLSRDDYQRILESQNRVCAICKEPPTTTMRLAVDHDHQTGKVRGLLCRECNRGLGIFKDLPERLRAAAAYLEQPLSSSV